MQLLVSMKLVFRIWFLVINRSKFLLKLLIILIIFRSSPAGTVTQDDILDITDKLHEDFRFKALDRLDPDRKLMLFQVINVLCFFSIKYCDQI